MSAQRRAETEGQAQAHAAAAQRRVEYEEQIRAQQAAQRRAKRARQQREWEARPAYPPSSAPAIETPTPEPISMPEAQAEVEVAEGPIVQPRLSESERRQTVLRRSCRALQNEISSWITVSAMRLSASSIGTADRFPGISKCLPRRNRSCHGSVVTLTALLLAGFMLASGGGMAWAASGLIGCGVGWWTCRRCVSVLPAEYMAEPGAKSSAVAQCNNAI